MKPIPINKWNNKNNIEFYEEVAFGQLEQYAALAGLETCCDMELIKNYIINAKSILEVGAGYGRVINYILDHGYKGKLVAIERGNNFHNILNQKFSKRVEILHEDLTEISIKEQFEAILWMWSGISDFTKKEQFILLKKLKNSLTSDGVIIIDTLIHSRKLVNESYSSGKKYIICAPSSKAYGYKPSPREIYKFANDLELELLTTFLHYKTNTTTRNIFILHNVKN